ncbi:methyltransferase [Acetobacteraceae bacterium ESL0709]|nr:methyltransferase [Acetobacteraceae bacterium ESL0697]MDF7679067.1 methyltransferase [Acetobacteraceae bacterium ESL0709]
MSRLISFSVRNNIFEDLYNCPCSANELAVRRGFKSDIIQRLLLGLVHLGLVKKEREKFVLAEDGFLLLQKAPTGFAAMTQLWSELFDGAWQVIDQTAKTGIPGFEIVHGEPIFAFIGRDSALAKTFDTAMSGLTNIIATEVANHIALSELTLLCDVGGGNGALMRTILASNPQMKGLVFDLPHVIERAIVVTEPGVITFIGGDFFESVSSAPAHILSNVIHDWSDQEAIRILHNVWRAQPREGVIYLVEMMLDHDEEPILARSTDLNMLMLTGGCERSYTDFDRLLSRAGFKILSVEKIVDFTCLITARRIDVAH